MALVVVVVIAIDKPQKRKAYIKYKVFLLLLLLLLLFCLPLSLSSALSPSRSSFQSKFTKIDRAHTNRTIESPTAHHVSFLYAILFWIKSEKKIHCCHSKCLSISPSRYVFVHNFFFSFTLLFMQRWRARERERAKCLYGFLSILLCSIKMMPVRSSRCSGFVWFLGPVYAYFYSILLLPLWKCKIFCW